MNRNGVNNATQMYLFVILLQHSGVEIIIYLNNKFFRDLAKSLSRPTLLLLYY
jgi:hypothetical protein